MKKYFVAILLCVFLVAIAAVLILNKRPAKAAGAFWYIDNAAAGTNNGASWANAWQSFAAINWTSIQPGDTIYISGGVVSKTYSETLSIGKSGISGSPITIKVGQDIGHNGTVILDGENITSHGIDINNKSWVVISGQLGSGNVPNIFVKNHATDEIRIDATTGIEMEYLDVGPNTFSGGDAGDCFEVYNYLGGGNRIHHNKIHDCYDKGIIIRPLVSFNGIANDDYLRIDHNEIYNAGDDLIHAGKITGGYTIDHNDMHSNPSGTGHSPGYTDGMQLRGFLHVTVANNKIYDLEGPDGMYSYIYFECDLIDCGPNGAASNIFILNNVIYETNQSFSPTSHGGITFACKQCTSLIGVRILNNTIVDLENGLLGLGSYAAPVSDVIIANNLLYNGFLQRKGSNRMPISLSYLDAPGGVTTGSFGDIPTPNIIWDYNLVDISGSDLLQGRYGTGNGILYTYNPDWKNISKGDAHGIATDPAFVNWTEGDAIDLHLSSIDAAAINKGIARIEFNDDFDGITRPQGSAWDIGAYEYIQTPPPLKGDFNTDGFVNDLDFTDFKNAFKSIFNSIFDLNSDSTIDVKDLGVLMSGWLEQEKDVRIN